MGQNVRWLTAAEAAETYAPIGSGGGIGGSIADQQVAFGDGTDIAGSDNFKWNNTDAALSLGVEGLPVSTTGNLRLTNQFEQKAQNSNNDADIPLLTWNGQTLKFGDQGVFGPEFLLDSRFGGSGELDGGGYTRVRSNGDVDIQADSGDIGLSASGVVSVTAPLSAQDAANVIVFPESDPHVAGAGYWLAGVLTKSAG